MVGYQKAIREEPTRFEYVGHGGAPACRKPPSEEPWCRRQASCLDAGSPPAPLPSPSCNADRSECRSRYRSYCIPFSTSLSVSSASALNGQPGRDPCFLALSILPHFCVAHGRQLTHGRPAGTSVTPCPSSRALSRPPCRGASRAPSRRPCRAEGSTLLASESAY